MADIEVKERCIATQADMGVTPVRRWITCKGVDTCSSLRAWHAERCRLMYFKLFMLFSPTPLTSFSSVADSSRQPQRVCYCLGLFSQQPASYNVLL
jgi:hypothetical protein